MPRSAPDWPRKMKVDYASAYVDESPSTFRSRVDDGIYPPARRIGGNCYWFREELDAALDKLCGSDPLPEPLDPYMEAINGNREAQAR